MAAEVYKTTISSSYLLAYFQRKHAVYTNCFFCIVLARAASGIANGALGHVPPSLGFHQFYL